MKHWMICLCVVSMAVLTVACGREIAGTDPIYPNAVLTGEVQLATEDALALLLGELTTQQPVESAADVPSASGTPDLIEQDGMTTFVAGEESVYLPVDPSVWDALSALLPGMLVQAETDGDGRVVTLTVLDLIDGQAGGPSSGFDSANQGRAAYTVAVDCRISNESFSSDVDGENALRVVGVSVMLDSITADKSAARCSPDVNGDFYGRSAALLACNGAQVTLTNARVISSSRNGCGVFLSGDGTDVTISDSAIEIPQDDKTSSCSEAVVVAGHSSVTLADCSVVGNRLGSQGDDVASVVSHVMLCRAPSEEKDTGPSVFTMEGGSLTGDGGDMFYVNNTSAVIEMSGVTLSDRDPAGVLLRTVGKDGRLGRETTGDSGAQVKFLARDQFLQGVILVDTVSSLDLTLSGSSAFTGTIQRMGSEEAGAENSTVNVTIETGSVWSLTGDCALTSLNNQGTVRLNGHTITLADGSILQESAG